jgi:hypothetical protein
MFKNSHKRAVSLIAHSPVKKVILNPGPVNLAGFLVLGMYSASVQYLAEMPSAIFSKVSSREAYALSN